MFSIWTRLKFCRLPKGLPPNKIDGKPVNSKFGHIRHVKPFQGLPPSLSSLNCFSRTLRE